MTHMGNHSQPDCFLFEILGFRRPSDASAVFPASMFGDGRLPSRRASRIEFANAHGKALDVFLIQFRAALSFPLFFPRPPFGVRQTFLFRPVQALFFNQETLSFILFSSMTPFENDRGQDRVFAGASREHRIPGREKEEMIQIGTGQTKSAFLPGECNPCLLTQILTTLVAGGVLI